MALHWENSTLVTLYQWVARGRAKAPLREKGYRAQDRNWNADLELAQEAAESYAVTLDPPSVRLFLSFLYECRQQGTAVIFVYPPEYIEGQQYILNREMVLGLYRYIARKYGILFLDYTTDPICWQRDLFYNSMHLNAKGAALFSKKLAHDLLRHKATGTVDRQAEK